MSGTASPENAEQGAEVIASALTTRAALEQLVASFPPDACFLGEHLPTEVVDDDRKMRPLLVRFARLGEVLQEASLLPWFVYTWGRVFCEEGELRWDGSEGELRVVYVGRERRLPAQLRESCRPLTGLFSSSAVSSYLFGESPRRVKAWEVGVPTEEEQHLFLTTRIPRPLFYPVNERRVEGWRYRAKIKIRLYQDAETGATVYFRFAGLESEIIPDEDRPEEAMHESV